MAKTVAERLKNTQYVQTVQEFIRSKGHVYCLTDDAHFVTVMRGLLTKDFGRQDALVNAGHPEQMLRLLREDNNAPRLLFVERVLGSQDMVAFVRQAKQEFSGLRVIVLTGETMRHRLVLMHEAGADNFIVKPISANGIVEKMAFTLKPQNKFGQLLDEARMHMLNGNAQEALDVCQQVLAIKPHSAAGLLAKGDALRVLQRPEEALDAYEQASESAEMYLEPLHKLAELHQELGNTEKQLRCLLRLNRLSPLHLERKLDIAALYLELGNLSSATGMFEEALRMATREGAEQAAWAASRAAALSAERDPAMCMMYLSKACVAGGPPPTQEDVRTVQRLGRTLCELGRANEAVVQYRHMLRLLPDDAGLCFSAGMACAEAHNVHEAQALLNKAIGLNPDLVRADAHTAYGIALVFIQGGGKDRATECLRIALECDPEYAPAKEALARMESASAR